MNTYSTLKVKDDGTVSTLQIYRPEANNTINDQLIKDLTQAIKEREESATVVILEGLPDVFCYGADFQGIKESMNRNEKPDPHPELLYDLWKKLADGPFVSIAHVRGKVNAGGVGFAAATDLVIADKTATFSLSELLFSLMPACVLPFLIRKIGFQKAHFLTLTTKPITAEEAFRWGLIDILEEKSDLALSRNIIRTKKLSKKGIIRYKAYASKLDHLVESSRACAIEANKEIFSDLENIAKIACFVETGKFPWEE